MSNAGLEATAAHLCAYDVRQVPDLLHTPDYTRAQYLAVTPHATETAVRDHLKLQHERQIALTQPISGYRTDR